MNSTELVDLFRSEMSDVAAPYLWSDALVYSYIDDAQTRFCRLTDGIADTRTPSVTRLNMVSGVDWYDTHVSIKNIRKATYNDTGRPVDLLTAEQADVANVVFSPTLIGPVRRLVLGLAAHSVRASPVPPTTYGPTLVSTGITAINTAVIPMTDTTDVYAAMGVTATGLPAGTKVVSVSSNVSITVSANATAAMPSGTVLSFGLIINLSVYRLPLVTITDDGEQTLEIDVQHHAALLYWVKSRAYDKQDAEAFDRTKSKDYATRFETYCAMAQQEQQRARRVQGNIAYGGI